MLFAIGSRFGGHALYVKDNRLHYVNNFVGAEEQMIVGTADIPTGENLILSASFEKEGMEPTCATGTLSLFHGETKVGEGKLKTQLGSYSIAGTGLYVGRHSGEAVTDDYPGEAPYAFTGGTINRIAVDVSGDPYVDLERQAEMSFAPSERVPAVLARHADARGDRGFRRARDDGRRAGLRPARRADRRLRLGDRVRHRRRIESAATMRSPRLSWEWAAVAAILALAAWLRLRQLGLAGFHDDQAIALRIGHDILHGDVRTVGLTSSSGAANPPLYVYMVAVLVAIHDGVIFVSASIAVLSVVAIALTYFAVRPRFGRAVALITIASFATAPWAVYFGRLLFQQDYLPVVSVALLWALFVVLERDRTWVALLVPVFVIAISLNLSAVSLILPIGALLAYRARDVNWRAVIAGAAVGVVLLGSWLAHNAKHGFRDFSLILNNGRGHGGTIGGGRSKRFAGRSISSAPKAGASSTARPTRAAWHGRSAARPESSSSCCSWSGS